MKKFCLALTVVLFAATSLFAQEFSKEEQDAINLAYEYSDNGNANKAIDIYTSLLKKYPNNSTLLYEMAYCYVVKQDFKTAIKWLKKSEAGNAPFGGAYAMHGNCLDNMGKRKEAIEKYKEGLSLFPDFGQLYLELGTTYALEDRLNEAVDTYTQGIKVAPFYTSNYYRISQLLCQTNEPVWGIIYGEIHELLDPNSRRSEELSAAIYDAYNSNMRFTNDSTFRVSLTAIDQLSVAEDGETLVVPFENLFEQYTSRMEDPFIVKEKGHLDMLSLVENRRAFITRMFENGQNQQFLYPIFKYQQKILEAGHWEAYNMWLLRKGNDEEYSAWLEDNEEKFKAFANWYKENNFDPTATE